MKWSVFNLNLHKHIRDWSKVIPFDVYDYCIYITEDSAICLQIGQQPVQYLFQCTISVWQNSYCQIHDVNTLCFDLLLHFILISPWMYLILFGIYCFIANVIGTYCLFYTFNLSVFNSLFHDLIPLYPNVVFVWWATETKNVNPKVYKV